MSWDRLELRGGIHPNCAFSLPRGYYWIMRKLVILAGASWCCFCPFSTRAALLNLTRLGEGSIEPDVGVHSYSRGSKVTVTATPAAGWEVDHWEGDLSG